MPDYSKLTLADIAECKRRKAALLCGGQLPQADPGRWPTNRARHLGGGGTAWPVGEHAQPGQENQLKIRSQRVYENGRPVSYWLLRGQELPAGDPPIDPELAQALREMAERFPSPTPLAEDDGFD